MRRTEDGKPPDNRAGNNYKSNYSPDFARKGSQSVANVRYIIEKYTNRNDEDRKNFQEKTGGQGLTVNKIVENHHQVPCQSGSRYK